MTQKYELIVKGIRNFENKVTVTLALRDKKRFDGEIFDLDISLDRVEGAALEFYGSSWMLLPGYVKGTSCCQKRAPVQRRGIP